MNPGVTIIISHLNSERTIRRCLEDLLLQDYPRELIHIIVVDGGSTDNSISIVNQLNIFQIVIPKCSEAEGQIAGLQMARTEIIFFTNSDIYVPRNWIKKHLYWLEQGYDLVGGSVFWCGDKYAFSWNTMLPNSVRFAQTSGLGLGFCNCSTTKTMLRKVGGLKALSSQQDTEYSFQVMRHGGKMILDPSIRITHDHPFNSLYKEFRRAVGYSRNHVIVMRAVYGRLVFGSGHPTMVYIGIPIKDFFYHAVSMGYFKNKKMADSNRIKINIMQFYLYSLIGKSLGTLIGAISGSLKQNVSLYSLKNLHPQQRVDLDLVEPVIRN